MSTKLDAHELAQNRFPASKLSSERIIVYASAIREVAQPIADERDELREALELIASRSTETEPENPGFTGNEDDARHYGYERASWACGQIARAILAKYQTQANKEHA